MLVRLRGTMVASSIIDVRVGDWERSCPSDRHTEEEDIPEGGGALCM